MLYSYTNFLLRRVIALVLLSQFLITSIYSQKSPQDKRVTVNQTNVPLRKIFDAITAQTNIYFMGSNDDINTGELHSLNVNNEKLEIVIRTLFPAKEFTWILYGNVVTIKRQNPETNNLNNKEDQKPTREGGDSLINIQGYVANEKGEPIASATIQVKGTNLGATSRQDGSFKIAGVRANASLIITSVAFYTLEVPIRGKSSIGIISLREYIGILDETVIVAYGTTTKRLNTGNVASIKHGDIEKQPVNNPLYALQGRVAGLQLNPTGGLPGKAVNITIRGRNTIRGTTGGANPLIVVDGLPILNNITGLGSPSLSEFSALSFLNPNEIESIDILKDADATSIYGSRGANGVILVTTKKGKIGQSKVDINIQKGFGKVSKRIDVLHTNQYLMMRKEAYQNDGIDFINTFPYGVPEYKYLLAPDLFVWDQNKDVNWQNILLGGTAQYNDIQGSVSGGTSTMQYVIGGNYHKETTVFPGDNSDQKGSVHFSLTGNSLNQKLKTTISSNFMIDRTNLPSNDFTYQAVTLAPNAPNPYNEDGTINHALLPSGGRSWNNPFADLLKTSESNINNLLGSADVSYAILPSLMIRTTLGYNQLWGSSFRKTSPFFGRYPEDLTLPASSAFNNNTVKNLSIEPQANYTTVISKGMLSALVGASFQSTVTSTEQIDATGFTSDALLKNLAASTDNFLLNSSSHYKYTAFFGRLNYNWNNKYILNLTARRDGSSRFGPGSQFGNFGSLGAAWIFSEEDFIKKYLPIISFGKARFSYGSSGNDGIGDYQYLERYEAIGANPYQGATAYQSLGIFNSYYAWEVTKKMELGLELGLLKNRLLLTASYFRNRSNNQLLAYPFPSIVGPGTANYNNPALVQNMGVEITINSSNVKTKNFSWSSYFNFTRNRNKLVSFPNFEQSSYYNSLEIGMPFTGIARAFRSAGVDPMTGSYQFTTVDGKTVLTPEDPSRLDGGKYLRIDLNPKFYGGLGNTFNYNGFSLDVLFQFNKQTGVNPYFQFDLAGTGPLNLPVVEEERWKKSGDISTIQKVSSQYDVLFEAYDRAANSDYGFVDASYVRLKNVSLSWLLPGNLVSKVHIRNIRLYIQGQNLWTFTNYNGLDPETQSIGALPTLRTITFGVNMTF